MAACEIDSQFDSEERLVSGDLAVERGWDVQTIRPRSGGVSQTRRQRVILVLRCDSDGKWRYARGISQPGPLPAS
jgi:ketosteroid isomerase-like protein